jgi:hypothetical protein
MSETFHEILITIDKVNEKITIFVDHNCLGIWTFNEIKEKTFEFFDFLSAILKEKVYLSIEKHI